MKKITSFIFTYLFICSCSFAIDDMTMQDDWSDLSKIQDAWDNQKIITDDEFEKVIEQKTKKSKEKEEKKFKKKMGEALIKDNHLEVNAGKLKELAQDYPTLLVPTNIIYEKTTITPGFYKIISSKSKNNTYTINFYQGNSLIAKLPAIETTDDFDTETINFAKIIYFNNNKKAKIVYGCLDYNLMTETDSN